jgi:hypothetical protein
MPADMVTPEPHPLVGLGSVHGRHSVTSDNTRGKIK